MFSRLLILALWALSASAATYYIDFTAANDSANGTAKETPWKRAPGMTGFAGSYTHAAGDQFIFKGGVTWDNTIAPWTIAAVSSGTSGNRDYYGVDKTWYTGASWTQPTLDGGSLASGATSPYWNVLASHITIDDIALVNLGQAGVHQDVQAMRLYGVSDITVQNMTFAVYARLSMVVFNMSGSEKSNIAITGNDFSHACWGIGGQPGTNSPMTNVTIANNTFHDFHTQLTNPGGCHGNGMYFYTTNGTDSTAYMDNLHIYNNRFYGDFTGWETDPASMTSFIWTGAQYQGNAYVYNNVMSMSGGSFGYIFGVSGAASGASPSPTGTVNFYNNSGQFPSTANLLFELNGVDVATIKNNALVGGGRVMSTTYVPIGSLVSDYNDFYGWSNASFGTVNGTAYTYAQFATAGYEANGLNADPLFVSATDSGSGANLALQSNSTAIGAGVNLSALGIAALTSDKNGVARGATWDIGAYEYAAETPAAPAHRLGNGKLRGGKIR